MANKQKQTIQNKNKLNEDAFKTITIDISPTPSRK
jgi:hypothetical protein